MSDHLKKEPASGEWTMPEPEFRSTGGYTPKTAVHSAQDEIPTEPGLSDDDTEDETGGQNVRASTKTRIRHHKKRSGCSKTFGLMTAAIALSVFAIIAAVIYFFVFYKRAI